MKKLILTLIVFLLLIGAKLIVAQGYCDPYYVIKTIDSSVQHNSTLEIINDTLYLKINFPENYECLKLVKNMNVTVNFQSMVTGASLTKQKILFGNVKNLIPISRGIKEELTSGLFSFVNASVSYELSTGYKEVATVNLNADLLDKIRDVAGASTVELNKEGVNSHAVVTVPLFNNEGRYLAGVYISYSTPTGTFSTYSSSYRIEDGQIVFNVSMPASVQKIDRVYLVYIYGVYQIYPKSLKEKFISFTSNNPVWAFVFLLAGFVLLSLAFKRR